MNLSYQKQNTPERRERRVRDCQLQSLSVASIAMDPASRAEEERRSADRTSAASASDWPRLRVLYLGVIAALCILSDRACDALLHVSVSAGTRTPANGPYLWPQAALLGLQGLLLLLLQGSVQRIAKRLLKLMGFALFLAASYALVGEDPERDTWLHFGERWLPAVNTFGLRVSVQMSLRVANLVLATEVVRAGNPRAFVAGLRSLGLPNAVAEALDTVLALVPGSGGGGGGGGRGGGGRGGGGRGGGGRRWDDAADPSLGRIAVWRKQLRELREAPLGFFERRTQANIERASERTAAEADGADAVVVAGTALTMLGIKALKILPAIPFAPGHKLVILSPLYVLAAKGTKSPLGATWTGATMGIVACLMGDGRYGIMEVAKHVAPGLVCDVAWWWRTRTPTSQPSNAFAFALGGAMGLARVATILLVTRIASGPAAAYALLIPSFLIHVTFGLVSGSLLGKLLVLPKVPVQAQPHPQQP
jgi:uncharacterized membrane protein YgcG